MTDDKKKKGKGSTPKKEIPARKETPAVKKQSPIPEQLQRVPQTRTGDVLRQTREERGLTVEDVSSHINIRVTQIRAIEEGQLEGLPGMIYAQGFVKSYAQFLHLDPVDLARRFKAEHGGETGPKMELSFPEPLSEGNLPSPIMIGIAAIGVVLVLALWAIFSGGSKEDKVIAETIPQAPVASETAMAPLPVEPAPAVPTEGAMAPETTTVETAISPTGDEPVAIPDIVPATPAPAAVAETSAPAASAPAPPVAPAITAAQPMEPPSEVIEIKPPGHVVLRATEMSWVQVTDASGKVLLKKVLKPGEKYYVPDQKGLSLLTSNAGGVEFSVDGGRGVPLGRSGDIMRGVSLDPQSLKSRSTSHVRNY